ncbi:MAG: hypothetical protein JXA04_10830 [Gammaproteobacteria bacterium]|nr:hypothetical protein [Gammaproteobacteria bacterium]
MNSKLRILAMVGIAITFASSNAFSEELANETKLSNEAESDESAVLIIHRQKFTPPLSMDPMVLVNGEKAFELERAHYAELRLIPGKYTIYFDWGWKGGTSRQVEVELSAGDKKTIDMSGSINFIVTSVGAIGNSNSDYEVGESVDISGSERVREWHDSWYLSSKYVSDKDKEKYLNEFVDEIKSDDFERMRSAAELVEDLEFYHQDILDALYQQVSAYYLGEYTDDLQIDSVAWLCKALASSKDKKYVPILTDVYNKAGVMDIRKYARKYLKKYYNIKLKKPK